MINKYIIVLVLILSGMSVMSAQSSDDFFNTNYELDEIDENSKKIEKKRFFLVNEEVVVLDKTFLDNCQNFIESSPNMNIGDFLNEYYFFYKETPLLNRNNLVSFEKLLEEHLDDNVAILRYVKTSSGADKFFSTMENGKIKMLYVNDIEKSKVN